jgi:hypothetical protein
MKIKLFITAFIQVALVSVNTIFLAKHRPDLVFLAAFGISYIWTLNVKRAAFGGEADKIIYALGAACGSVFGMYLAEWLL